MPPALPHESNGRDHPVVTPQRNLRRLVRDLLKDVTPARLVVASDFDGTLAPVVARPEEAVAPVAALAALERLVELGARVAVISGRSRDALDRVVPIPGVRRLGDYGLEEPSAAERDALERFNVDVSVRIRARPGVTLEAKPGSTSVHYRNDPTGGTGLFDELAPLAAQLGLRAGEGRMVVEVRPPGADKGAALQRLLEAERPAAVAFAGDDDGDRAAFEAAARHERHLVVGVRSDESPPDLFAACDAVVDNPAGWLMVLDLIGDVLQKSGDR